jgi:uncharacterized membrane protein
MNRRLLVGIVVIALAFAGVALAFSAMQADRGDAGESLTLAQTDDVDRTVFRIEVYEDGDARWTVENRREISISAEDEIAEFETFADRFAEEETETFANFRQRAVQLTQEGESVTGREMNATAFDRSAEYDALNQEGVLNMSFRWEGFAEVDGDRVVVSDVFDGGFAILEDQRLRFEHGEGLRFEDVTDEYPPDRVEGDDSPGEWVQWNGPREFSSGNPEIVFVVVDGATDDSSDGPGGAGDDSPGDDSPGDDSSGDGGPDESGDGSSDLMLPVLFALLVIVGVGSGALWYSLGSRDDGSGSGTAPTAPSNPAGPASPELQEEQLLSDEDRIVKLLEDNGGRMRQVSIVEETEWSKSKVSMLLSEMEEDGEISKLRVGRENIISLAGQEPAAAGSPFEDEES